MKTKTFIGLLLLALTTGFSSCSGDDDDYPSQEQILGKWEVTSVYAGDRWYDVTVYPYTRLGASLTLYANGTFRGTGYFGNGTGTYTYRKGTIQTFLDGEPYFKYVIKSFSDTSAQLIMSDQSGGSTEIMVRKVA